jgi:hypothetical protein
MTTADWITWSVYEAAVAIVVHARTVRWFRDRFRVTGVQLEGWVALNMTAFFTALALGQWLGTGWLAPLIAFGLASAMIVSAAVNAAYEGGLSGSGPDG